ncbi:MAG: Uma2 family endonuclease [Myxococcota bacterium]
MEALNRASPPRHRQQPGKFRLSRQLFHELDERGAFEGLRVELLEGEIFVMAPMDQSHAVPIQQLTRQLNRLLSDEYAVRPQMPIAPDDESEPEPDLAVLPAREAAGEETPCGALLAIEVANTSLRDDLERKSRIYARAGIPEYWVVDVRKKELVVHRSPHGERYRSVRHLTELSAVKSSAIPGLVLDLRNIFVKR